MAEMAAAVWAAAKAAAAYIAGSFQAVAAGTATMGQVATYVAVTAAGSMALNAAAGMLMKPSAGSRPPGEWIADPRAGIPFAIGERIGVGGNIVYKNTFGKDNEYKGIVTVLSGAGPIGGYLDFTADRERVTFSGEAATGRWGGEMWRQTRLGNQPDTALTSPSLGGYSLPGWSAAHKLSGKAAFLWTLRMDSKFSTFPQGEPAPITTVQGIRGYDHRLDSTHPGGMGPVRLNDRSTWPVITNPIIADLNWCLGLRENGRVVGGLGVPAAGVDWPAYTAAANAADANGWKIAAYPRSDENKTEVRAAMLQAGGAVISRRAGLVSCVTRGVSKSPVMTITAADTAGPIELDTAANLLNRWNQITPGFLSEAHDWQVVPAAPVTSEVYVAEDRGRVRSDARNYPYVPAAKQAAELAALDLAHSREGIAGRWPLKPHCRDIEPGEVFRVREPGFLLHDQDMLCVTRDYDPATDTVGVVFVSVTPGAVEWALGQAANPPPTPALSAMVTLNPPDPDDWQVLPRPPSPGGEIPTVDVVGEVRNPRAEAVVIQYRAVDYDDADPPQIIPLPDEVDDPEAWSALTWTAFYDGPPDLASMAITGLEPGVSYWVRIYYRSSQDGVSRSLIRGPVKAGDLVATDANRWGGRPSTDFFTLIDLYLKGFSDRMGGMLDETEKRRVFISDVMARLGVAGVFDPVAKTGFLNGTTLLIDEGGLTLVQTRDGLIAADADNLALVLDEREARIEGDEAEALARSLAIALLGDQIAFAGLELRGYVDDEIAEATAGLATTAYVASAVSLADLNLRSWTNGQISTATAGLVTTAALDSAIALAAVDAQARVDSYRAEAEASFASAASFAGLTSAVGVHTLAIAGLEAQNNLARLELVAAAAGGQPARFALRSDSQGADIAFDADRIWFGPWTRFHMPSRTFIIDVPGGSVRLMWGGPFGTDGKMLLWLGANTVEPADATKALADFYIHPEGGPGGRPDVGGPSLPSGGGDGNGTFTGTDVLSGSLSGSGWQTVKTFTLTGVRAGSIDVAVSTVGSETAGGANWTGEVRLREVGGAVVAGPESIVVANLTEDPASTAALAGDVSATGSVTYQLQFSKTGGADVSTLRGDLSVSTTPRLT